VDFGFARTDDAKGWMSVHHAAEVAKDGTVNAMVVGLLAGVEYRVTARAHHKDSSEGWNEKWSAMTVESATCISGLEELSQNRMRVVSQRQADSALATTWIEVFRYRGPGYGSKPTITDYNLPDYLDNHNTGDANKQLSRWDFPGSGGVVDFNVVSYSRYCIEILNVELQPTVHAVGAGGPTKSSAFANYLPCDGGKCHCTNRFDTFTLEAELNTERSFVDANCPLGQSGNCACDESQLILGNNYTGRWSFSPPFTDSAWMSSDGNPQCGWGQHQYPCHGDASPKGFWYHHPEDARCVGDAAVGQGGCTWKRSAVVYTMSVQQLLDAGSIGGTPSYRQMSIEEELQSVEHGQRAFASIGATPCGPSASPQVMV
jgi:hypothetical protein